MMEDERQLINPIPHWKNKSDRMNNRNELSWTWVKWRTWIKSCWSRTWRKRYIRRMLTKRNACLGMERVDFKDCEEIATMRGWIYVIYQFSTGRVYVGQTIGTLFYRAQLHWWERKRVHDLFHQALATEQNPFSFVIFPLEKVAEREWTRSSWQESKEVFRNVATRKERYWVKRLNTMWPHGWNSAWPGKPISPHVARSGRTVPVPEAEAGSPELWSRYLMEYENNPPEVESQLKRLQKLHLRRLLDWLGTNANSDKPAARAMEMLLLDLLKVTPKKRSRQYVQFFFGTPLADGCQLRRVLRDPEIYTLHPEPSLAASLRVSEAYTPQIGQRLLNYTSSSLNVSEEPEEPEQQSIEELCTCAQVLRLSLTEEEKKNNLIEGHVCTPWLKNLKWPYLQAIGKVGRKYRTSLSIDEVLQSLQEGLKSYIGWYRKRNGSVKLEQLKKWADAVVNKCRLNVDKVMLGTSLKPDGYSGLVAQLTEAKGLLTFVPDDRGPQIVHACCTKWYQRNLRKIIADARTYEKCTETWDSILQVMKERLMKYGFGSLEGRPYLYGIFKAKKTQMETDCGNYLKRR